MIDQCLAAGVLREAAATLEFRHELARQAVLDSLSAMRRQQLHWRALQALRAAPGNDLARLAHHAEAAQDGEAMLEFEPRAERQAAALGAHREPARHYRTAMLRAGSVDDEDRRRWLERCTEECLEVDWHDEAIATEATPLAKQAISAGWPCCTCSECPMRKAMRRAEGLSNCSKRLLPAPRWRLPTALKRRYACSTAIAPTAPQGEAGRLRWPALSTVASFSDRILYSTAMRIF